MYILIYIKVFFDGRIPSSNYLDSENLIEEKANENKVNKLYACKRVYIRCFKHISIHKYNESFTFISIYVTQLPPVKK